MSNTLQFTINDFSGPLDLLLHLVKESKMDIYEVPIEHITNEYVEFIKSMEEMDIDVASEYLVLASELIHLKSRMLLNIKDPEDEGDQLEFKIGTEEELRHRLYEYKKYKEVSEDFRTLEAKRSEVYTKVPESLNEYREAVELSSDTSLEDLVSAMCEFLERQKYMKPLSTKITKKEISVERRSYEIRELLKTHRKVDFFDLFESINREYVVVTFLSVLEMTKKGEICIKQDKNFANITIEAK
ncbi:MAG TPA: segregation/condensation protein A [Firmicutes bacterium]|nr:segregation/condensation protein A [Bacillota bacterium]